MALVSHKKGAGSLIQKSPNPFPSLMGRLRSQFHHCDGKNNMVEPSNNRSMTWHGALIVLALLCDGLMLKTGADINYPLMWMVLAWAVGSVIGGYHYAGTKNVLLGIAWGGPIGIFVLIGLTMTPVAWLFVRP
jgi:hypothetical protein